MQQVADWLEKLGLGQYAQRFAENDIDFALLTKLTDVDLKELGVASLGHRKRLLEGIAERTVAMPWATPAQPKVQDTAERRQVTVMFSDLVGSTALSAQAVCAITNPRLGATSAPPPLGIAKVASIEHSSSSSAPRSRSSL